MSFWFQLLQWNGFREAQAGFKKSQPLRLVSSLATIDVSFDYSLIERNDSTRPTQCMQLFMMDPGINNRRMAKACGRHQYYIGLASGDI